MIEKNGMHGLKNLSEENTVIILLYSSDHGHSFSTGERKQAEQAGQGVEDQKEQPGQLSDGHARARQGKLH